MSTKTEDLDEAKEVARDAYIDAYHKDKNGLPVVSRRFKSIAEAVRDKFKHDYENKIGPTVYRDYYQAIDNWLITFFGHMNVATIGPQHIKEFYEDLNRPGFSGGFLS